MSEDSPTRQVRVRRRRDLVGGLTFQEQADIQRAMYASLHVGRHQLTKAVCSSDSQPTGYSQAVATVLTTTAACSTTTITSSVVHSSEQPPPAKKKRGRPRKYPKAETTVPNAAVTSHHLASTTPNKPVLPPAPNPGITTSPKGIKRKKLPLLIDMSTFFDTSIQINSKPADSSNKLPRVAIKQSVVQSIAGSDSSTSFSLSSSSSTPALSPLESHMKTVLGTTVTSSLNCQSGKGRVQVTKKPRKLAMSASIKGSTETNPGVKKAVTFQSKAIIVEPSNRTAVPSTSLVPMKSAFKSPRTPPDLIKIVNFTSSADQSGLDTRQSVVPIVVETAKPPVQRDGDPDYDHSEVWHDTTGDKPPNVPSTFQAQRKFAQNQNPPYLSTNISQEKLCCPKEIPKTEDFIKYLCVRGAAEDIPEELSTFNKPWTPKSARNRHKARPRVNTKPITSLKPLLSSLPAKKLVQKV